MLVERHAHCRAIRHELAVLLRRAGADEEIVVHKAHGSLAVGSQLAPHQDCQHALPAPLGRPPAEAVAQVHKDLVDSSFRHVVLEQLEQSRRVEELAEALGGVRRDERDARSPRRQ